MLSENINILRRKKIGMLLEFYHRFMYISPSSDHELLTLILPFLK